MTAMFLYQHTEAGPKHVSVGMANQDACLLVASGPFAIALAADGMSSARLAGKASTAAVEAASKIICASFMPDATFSGISARSSLQASFAAACNALHRLVSHEKCNLEDLNTTLMAAVYDSEQRMLYYATVGDGGIVVRRTNGTIELLTEPQKGENYYQTSSLLDPNAWAFGESGEVDAMIMATDGVLDAICSFDPPTRSFAPGVRAGAVMAAACEEPQATYKEPQTTCDGFHEDESNEVRRARLDSLFLEDFLSCINDDRTLIVVTRNQGGAPNVDALPDFLQDDLPIEGQSGFVPMTEKLRPSAQRTGRKQIRQAKRVNQTYQPRQLAQTNQLHQIYQPDQTCQPHQTHQPSQTYQTSTRRSTFEKTALAVRVLRKMVRTSRGSDDARAN